MYSAFAARVVRPVLSAGARHLSTSVARPAPRIAASTFLNSRASASVLRQAGQVRFASSGSLSKDDISSRILEVLKSFEKVDAAKVSANSSFTNDLGLDSLDAVEVVMAIEEEFSIEIPDEEADAITTVGQAIDYISNTPEAH